MIEPLDAPFPYFGGKSRAAETIWEAFGQVENYVEPFAGSAAMLLRAPEGRRVETLNDKDGFIANFWRAIADDPDAVAHHADWPVNEKDLHARHSWIVRQRDTITAALDEPTYYDAKIAGWWVWGACAWIGSGWCSGDGPWVFEDGHLVNARKLPHRGGAGMGINRQLPHLGGAGIGINRKLPHLSRASIGINRKLPHLSGGRGEFIRDWFTALSERLRDVRVACGDWARVLSDAVTTHNGMTAVFLDPPYTLGNMDYAIGGAGGGLAADVRAWCRQNGANPLLRIVICGHAGEHDALLDDGWSIRKWRAKKGYALSDDARARAVRNHLVQPALHTRSSPAGRPVQSGRRLTRERTPPNERRGNQTNGRPIPCVAATKGFRPGRRYCFSAERAAKFAGASVADWNESSHSRASPTNDSAHDGSATMKHIDRIDIWWVRLPLGRWFEAFVVAGILFFVAALLWPRSAIAQDAEANKHIATMAAFEKQAEAQIELARTLRAAIERISGGPVPATIAAPPSANPAAKTCDGFGSCTLGVFRSLVDGVGDVTRALAPIAMPYYGYKGQLVAAETARVTSQEATRQTGLREATTQAGFAAAANIAASGTAGLVAVATQPSVPTTAIALTSNTGPVLIGGGTLTSGSNNPTNPAPVVCTVATATVPSTCSRGP